MYLIDTNIHAAFLLQNYEQDDLTAKYMTLYNSIPLADRVIPDFILSEFETFIMQVAPSQYKLKPKQAKKLKNLALEYIERLTRECTIIVPAIRTVQKAGSLYIQNTTSISFTDCLSLMTARHNAYTLFTKNKKMETLAKKLYITTYTPDPKS